MAHSVKFDEFDDNVEIRSINSLFRSLRDHTWYIHLDLKPEQEKSSLSLSQAPVIARKRKLNPTGDVSKKPGYRTSFAAPSGAKWETCRMRDCPATKQTRTTYDADRQWCFRFAREDGLTVYLPQFELARALFFHDAYLARSSLNSERFYLEFAIQKSPGPGQPTKIEVLPTSSYPHTQLESYASRRIVSWILLDQNARNSYESISKRQMLEGTNVWGYRKWDFRFEPPVLVGSTFSVRGQYDKPSKSLLVYEIDQIANIPHSVPGPVEISHQKFKDYSGSHSVCIPNQQGESGVGVRKVRDDELANSDAQHILMDAPAVGLGFTNPFETKRIAATKPKTRAVKEDGEEPGPVSTGEGTVLGTAPQASWVMQEDISDDDSLYGAKFDRFFEMVDLLCKTYPIRLSQKSLRKLPKLPRCKKHLIAFTGDPRAWAVVHLRFQSNEFVLLEVDTSDQAKALSSCLLHLKDPSSWSGQLQVIEQELVRKSLTWPKGYLKKICVPGGTRIIPHPRSEKANKGVVSEEALEPWAARVFSKLAELSKA